MCHYRCYKVYSPSIRKIIITNAIKHMEDNSFETQCKFNVCNFLEASHGTKDLTEKEPALPAQNYNTRETETHNLYELLSQPNKIQPSQNMNPESVPRDSVQNAERERADPDNYYQLPSNKDQDVIVKQEINYANDPLEPLECSFQDKSTRINTRNNLNPSAK